VAAAGSTFVLLPKLAFDLRDAGVVLSPDTTIDAAEDSLELPVGRDAGWLSMSESLDTETDTDGNSLEPPSGTPLEAFDQRDRAVFVKALASACFHLFFPGIPLVGFVGVVGLTTGSFLILGALVVATFLFVLALDGAAMWLAHANVEYRIYEDQLVAYDRFLEEPQWVLPVADITALSAPPEAPENKLFELFGDGTAPRNYVYGWLPSVDVPVRVERRDGEALVLEYLDQPEAFVRAVEARRASPTAARTRRPLPIRSAVMASPEFPDGTHRTISGGRRGRGTGRAAERSATDFVRGVDGWHRHRPRSQ
jgi:hypothetical protein